MTTLHFNTEDDFLQELDGKVYCIADATNENFLCDIHESDYIKFYDDGKLLDLNTERDFDIETLGRVSDYPIADNKYKDEVFSKKLIITIGNKKDF